MHLIIVLNEIYKVILICDRLAVRVVCRVPILIYIFQGMISHSLEKAH